MVIALMSLGVMDEGGWLAAQDWAMVALACDAGAYWMKGEEGFALLSPPAVISPL